MVIEQEVEIRMADGTSEGYIYRHEDGRRRPGVLHLTDIGGIRAANREMARQLAEKGYTVLIPNLFYRIGRAPMFDFEVKIGEERTMKRFAELASSLPPEAMERDAPGYVDFLAGQDSAGEGAMGVVGYCFSGSVAMRIAAMRPDRIAAAASFHGGRLFTEAPTSPHLALPRIQAALFRTRDQGWQHAAGGNRKAGRGA